MLKGLLFSLFISSLRLISGPKIISQQYWHLGLEYFFITNALTLASVLTTWVRSYLCLQNYLHSRHPRGVCSIGIPAAYLYAEVCIVFTFHVVSKAHINAYNIVSEAVLISRPLVLSLQQCYYLGLCIDSLGELLPGPAELSLKQIS